MQRHPYPNQRRQGRQPEVGIKISQPGIAQPFQRLQQRLPQLGKDRDHDHQQEQFQGGESPGFPLVQLKTKFAYLQQRHDAQNHPQPGEGDQQPVGNEQVAQKSLPEHVAPGLFRGNALLVILAQQRIHQPAAAGQHRLAQELHSVHRGVDRIEIDAGSEIDCRNAPLQEGHVIRPRSVQRIVDRKKMRGIFQIVVAQPAVGGISIFHQPGRRLMVLHIDKGDQPPLAAGHIDAEHQRHFIDVGKSFDEIPRADQVAFLRPKSTENHGIAAGQLAPQPGQFDGAGGAGGVVAGTGIVPLVGIDMPAHHDDRIAAAGKHPYRSAAAGVDPVAGMVEPEHV